MTEPIISIDQIKQQAAQAATQYSDVNDACPYPFYSAAGRIFKQEFLRLRLAKFAANHATKPIGTAEVQA